MQKKITFVFFFLFCFSFFFAFVFFGLFSEKKGVILVKKKKKNGFIILLNHWGRFVAPHYASSMIIGTLAGALFRFCVFFVYMSSLKKHKVT